MQQFFIIDPALKEFATDLQKEQIDAVNKHGGFRAASRALGHKCQDGVRQNLKVLISRGMDELRRREIAPKDTPGFVVTSKSAAFDGDGELRAEWIKEKQAPIGEPGGEGEGDARDGGGSYLIKGVSTLFDANGNPRAQWVKTKLDDQLRMAEMRAHIDGARDTIEPAEPLAAPAECDEDLLTVYPQGDPHCGLYTWEAETGQKFDLQEFERINRLAIDRLVLSTPRSAVAIYNDKGDSTHADNGKNRTPKSGHELDVHGRHPEVVRTSIRIKRYQIARLLEKHQKVIVRIDPGNHDPETALHQALVLEALYENEPRVEVVASPNPFWYYLFGSNLIGTCHGDGAKGKDLPLIMATDRPKWWGEADFRVWFVGHVHHLDIKEYNGCVVEHVRTLAPNDAHHHREGFRSKRDIKAITYHRADGEIERQTCSLKRILASEAASSRQAI